MQHLAISMMRLFPLTIEYSTPVKTEMQMYDDGANKNEGNDYECQDVCNHVEHIIPYLSLFVARSQIIDHLLSEYCLMQRRGSSFIRPYRPTFLEYHLMQALVMFVTRLFRLPLEHTTPVKTKKQMDNDSTNKDKGNDYECQDVCNHVEHIIPRLSVARSHVSHFLLLST